MSTLVAQGLKALEYIKKAVDLAHSSVKPTFGPNASTTLMYRTFNRGPRFVDDGFWTLESIVPKNPYIKLAYEAFKEATMQTNRKVGDGTSQTTILAATLFNDLYAKLYAGTQGYSGTTKKIDYRTEIKVRAHEIKELIKQAARKVETKEELEKISSISLGEDSELSKTIAGMAWEVGVDGFIDVVEGYKGEVETELIKGARFPAKVSGKAFVNKPERYEMVVEDCPVFITNYKLDNDTLLRYVLQEKFKGVTKLILIAPDFSNDILVNMVLARQNGTFLWPVKAPSLRTEQMDDLAIFCGAKLVNKDAGDTLQNTSIEVLGHVEKLILKDVETKEDAVVIGGKGEKEGAVKDRIATLRGQLTETKEYQFKGLMERRIASMASAGGVIRVGAASEAESLPLKLKVEDDVFACRAALRGGHVKGGGLCLKEIADTLPDDHILKHTLQAPYAQIQENTGGIEIADDVLDPAEAVYYAVEHATSVVASLITVKTLVAEEPEYGTGEGEMKIANAIHMSTLAQMKKDGIINENEKAMMDDARLGMTEAEYNFTHQD